MKQIHILACVAVVGLASLAFAQRPEGTSGELPLLITGTAVSVGGVGNPTGAARVEIRLTGTSSAAARERMLAALKIGTQALLEELRDAPSVGSIRFGTQLAWDLHYAQRQPGEEGGVRLTLATDRPMTPWELWNQPRYSQYPFTLINLQLDANGRGTGDMMLAARITAEPSGRFVHVENFASEPIQLNELEARVDR
jgi:hypothetical protein